MTCKSGSSRRASRQQFLAGCLHACRQPVDENASLICLRVTVPRLAFCPEAFVKSVQQRIEPARLAAIEIPQEQRRKPVELARWLAMCATREEALRRAHLEGGMSMSAIAKALNLSDSRVSRLIARFEGCGAGQ